MHDGNGVAWAAPFLMKKLIDNQILRCYILHLSESFG